MRIFSSMILSSLAIDCSREGSSSSTFAKSARASLSFQTAAWALARLYKAFTLSVRQHGISSNCTIILTIMVSDWRKPAKNKSGGFPHFSGEWTVILSESNFGFETFCRRNGASRCLTFVFKEQGGAVVDYFVVLALEQLALAVVEKQRCDHMV